MKKNTYKTASELCPVDAQTVQAGMRFTAPLFFDEGVNLFAAQGQPLNGFHLRAIQDWHIDFLYTSGEPDNSEDREDLEDLEDLEEL
ncbi:MAG: phosphohydrolase [Treponema sp.]|jgi:hypothetical protein|nr:phosphohydrolase [Treponema sp.]